MFRTASLAYGGFGNASRLRTGLAQTGGLTAVELATLIAAGVLAAAAVAFLPLQLRIPGHVVIKAAVPMILGVALVPRQFAGTLAGLAAAVTTGVFLTIGVGRLQPAAIAALLAIGPAIDLAVRGANRGGWSLYLRFAAAGMAANLLSFAVRWITSWLRLDAGVPHRLPQIDYNVLLSFAGCGFVAGIVCAAVCFRASQRVEQ